MGDVIRFKCDVHPWMTAYLLVTDNPYYAISGDDGSFTIANVPPGRYTVEIWHEKSGYPDQRGDGGRRGAGTAGPAVQRQVAPPA